MQDSPTAHVPTTSGGHLDPDVLRTWIAASDAPRVLDVRSPAEYEAVHIPGSYNVPLDLLQEHREEVTRHLDEQVVLVCRSGMRAQQAGRTFADVGLSNVHILRGGITAWQAVGGAVNQGPERWDLERQVRFAAGSLVLGAGLGSIFEPRARWLAIAVGGGLVGAALTDTCAMGTALSKLPFNRGAAACTVEDVVSQLTGPETGNH